MTEGYYDDFALDFNWQVSGNATTGIWVRDVPIGTLSGTVPANPGADLASDFGKEAYITGNGGGGAGNDDVDNVDPSLLVEVVVLLLLIGNNR